MRSACQGHREGDRDVLRVIPDVGQSQGQGQSNKGSTAGSPGQTNTEDLKISEQFSKQKQKMRPLGVIIPETESVTRVEDDISVTVSFPRGSRDLHAPHTGLYILVFRHLN